MVIRTTINDIAPAEAREFARVTATLPRTAPKKAPTSEPAK
jgi:hypothetical protein